VSLRNPSQDLQYQETLGMDATSNVATVPQGYVRDAWNCDIGLSGGYVKRSGHSDVLGTEWTDRTINAGVEYSTAAIAARQVVAGTDGADTRLGYVDAGAVSEFKTGLSAAARGAFVQLNTLLAYFNGSDAPVIYDGTNTRQMGITAPTNAATGSQGTSGSLTALATYSYAYTYYNSATGAESSPSPLYTVTLTGANDDVTLTVTAGSAATADTIRIYRTVANGNQLFLEGTAAIGATSFNSTAADSALTAPIELDNSRVTAFVPSLNAIQAQFPVVVANRLFVKTDRNVVRFSKIGQSGPMFESFQVQAAAYCKGTHGDTDDVVGNGKAGDIPIVIKQRSFGRLEAVGNPFQAATDPVLYVYTEMSDTVGGLSHWAGGEANGEYLWLGRDNVYATDGRSFRTVADRLSSLIQSLGFLASQETKVSFINDTKNQRVLFSVFSSFSATYPDYQLVGDYRKKDESGRPFYRWTTYRPGTNSNTHPGIRAGCFWRSKSATDGSMLVYAGNIEANGQFYLLNDGDDDRGSGIHFRLKGRADHQGNPLEKKLYKFTRFHAQGDGNDYDLTVSSIYDLSGSEEDPETFSLVAPGSGIWDTGLWDVATWADASLGRYQYDVHRKAEFQELVFENTGADEPVTIFGWGTMASAFRAFAGSR
jgi:hypothetical protein